MFDFIDNYKKVNNKSIIDDFFYSLDYIREYVYDECISFENKKIKSKHKVAQEISNQFNLYLKNKVISYLLVHEYNIAKEAKILDGINNNEKFHDFILLTNNIDWVIYFAEKYPVVRDKINNLVNNFLYYIKSFFIRLYEDWEEIKIKFNLQENYVENVSFFLGDLHKNNCFVLSLQFENKTKLFYKPRNFENEFFFKDFTDFLNKLDFEIILKIPNSISNENYCWVEEIKYTNDFFDNQEIENYYYNLGKIVFLFHLLGSVDIIPDNMIISDNKPSFFDLECIFEKPKFANRYSLRYELEESIFKTGILPDKMFNNNFDLEILSSLFFKFNEQLNVQKEWICNQNFDFSLKLVKEKNNLKKDFHLPKLKGELIEIDFKLLEKFVSGFEDCYRKSILKSEDIFRFFTKKYYNDLKIRVLLHPTSVYDLFMNENNMPENILNTNKISRLIKELVENTNVDNYNINKRKLINSLKNQIQKNDIPYFYYCVKNDALYDGYDKAISKNWNFSIENYLKERLLSLNEKNLNLQKTLIFKKTEFYLETKKIEKNFINSKLLWKTALKKHQNLIIKSI